MAAGKPSFAKFGQKKIDRYLELLREGNSRSSSARGCGVSSELVRLYRHATPGFAQMEEDAEMDACGKVEDALYQTALSGNVIACQVWLYNRAPTRWKDKRQVAAEVSARVETVHSNKSDAERRAEALAILKSHGIQVMDDGSGNTQDVATGSDGATLDGGEPVAG